MDVLLEEHERLVETGNLGKSVGDVQKTIDLLIKARESIATSMWSTPRPRDRSHTMTTPPSQVKLE